MPISYVDYQLENGFVQNWLVAGPQTFPLTKGEQPSDGDIAKQIASIYYEEEPGIQEMPVERGPLTEGVFKIGDYEGAWSYMRCREDHLVDLSAFYPSLCYLRSWAYTQVSCEVDQNVQLIMTTFGPIDVWVNQQHVHRHERFDQRAPASLSFPVKFQGGRNEILVRFENLAFGDTPFGISLKICGLNNTAGSQGMMVQIPTLINARSIGRRHELETTFESVYVEREVCALNQPFSVHWPEEQPVSAPATVRLQTPSGRIYAESEADGVPGETHILNHPYQMPEGGYQVLLMPRPWEFYEHHLRFSKILKVWGLGKKTFSGEPYQTYEERRLEALKSAAGTQGNLFAEIAKMALGKWAEVDTHIIELAIESVHRQDAGSILTLSGLLGMQRRFGNRPDFPRVLRKSIRDCALDFRYTDDEQNFGGLRDDGESRRILLATCEVLAGQLYPEGNFSHSRRTGRWHREQGEERALEWLHERGSWGFSDWDSDTSFAEMITALSHLLDLAKKRQVWEMATVVMEKIFYSMALNSFHGVFGSTRRWTDTASLKGGILEATSGIMRLLWGTGIFNQHLHGAVSLACVTKYELPPLFAEIAANPPEEIWNRERHRISPPTHFAGREQEVHKVTYKTPDYMLCSAQDYDPGKMGRKEHLWQATLGPEAAVFVNHPGCSTEEDAHTPNFWLGNVVLPRVAQWRDALIAIHHLPDDDRMGFTHAYFPTIAFDEYVLRESEMGQTWAFARKGDGYLALTASQGLTLIRSGKHALRELRSVGRDNVWLCHMGRAAIDGDFQNFQERVLALGVKFDGLAVEFPTLHGETLSFSWDGPFQRDGQAQLLKGFNHYENPYTVVDLPCEQMEIQTSNYLLRLNFGKGTGD